MTKTTTSQAFLLTAAITLGITCGALAAEPKLTDTYIFEHSTATNEAGVAVTTFYRIPSLVTAKDGTLLAFCNGRIGSAAGGNV